MRMEINYLTEDDEVDFGKASIDGDFGKASIDGDLGTFGELGFDAYLLSLASLLLSFLSF